MSGDKQNPNLYKQNVKMIRRCLAIISKNKTKYDAYTALEAAGVTSGFNLQCWVAYNKLPN